VAGKTPQPSNVEPVYRTVRELVLSYFESYFNLRGDRTLRAYSDPVDLARFDRTRPGWMTTDGDLWWIAEHLVGVRHTRLLSPAVEPLQPSRPKVLNGVLASLIGALVAALAVALGLELMDRRIRDPEDLMAIPGVPVVGVMRPAGSKRPVFRRLVASVPAMPTSPLLAAPGAGA